MLQNNVRQKNVRFYHRIYFACLNKSLTFQPAVCYIFAGFDFKSKGDELAATCRSQMAIANFDTIQTGG